MPEARPCPPSTPRRASRQHREWEHELNAGGWAMVPWPVEYGGRGADLLEWLIFEEEYYRAGRSGPREPERHLPPRPHHHGVRHPRAEGALPAEDGGFSDEVWAQGWSEPNAGSDMASDPGHGRESTATST